MGTSMIGAGSMSSQSTLQDARESQLIQQLGSAKPPTEDAKIEKGAKQFESMLLSSWLQQAEQSFATVPGADDDEDTGAKDQMMSMGVQSLAESLTNSGGIGIAAMISKAMHANAAKADAAAGAEGASAAEKDTSSAASGQIHKKI